MTIPPAVAAFIREHFAPIPAPVAKPPETVYHKPWKPTKGDMEPPF